ncbi:cystathionine beta-lyase [Hyphococcus flavus]|uniref:Cystathionine beta-lyase n=1 Tax=Hyphococcus flavus TaxID=1866326 RepID=A0AAE9ZB14_9PROT|nr:cystathionine beta-lyase [Hyphococcus flavus]WDI31129.1 cystathionine beta-lyase [Hyphococcus flavus]
MKDDTKLAAAGRPHHRPAHPVNPPVERASTYLFPTYDDYLEGAKSITYGRLGTPTHRALEEAVTALEGGFETRLAPSGLQACNAAILAFVATGDHILMTDAAYDPTRKFCEKFLKRFGVETTFYDPLASKEEVAALMRPNTKVVFAESPGSLTFEVQDLPMLAEAAHAGGAKLVADNTWSGGYYCKPIELGADVSIQAGTKYLAGHADCLIGTITSADEQTAKKIYYALLQLGSNVSADDAYLTLRGMRTLSTRLSRHQESTEELIKFFKKRDEIDRILHPALKSCPGHAIWKRDFSGASGLFGVVMKPAPLPALKAFFNALKLFGMGFSWGGFESLCLHVRPEQYRTATEWREEGHVLRIHAGLEDIDDLKADLERAFAAMHAALK